MCEASAPASPIIASANAQLRLRLPFADADDFVDARRGWLRSLSEPVIRATDGRVVWDADAYTFLDDECPDSVNPSLWRQCQLTAMHGLFEVAEGIYQVRGLDLSNMTIVEGRTGVLVIDPLISAECAAAALALYRAQRGERPVSGLLYTHSHSDHFGGARGIIPRCGSKDPEVPVYAPEGFMEHVVSEHVYAGVAMTRRAAYMYAEALPKGATGQVGTGLGQTCSTGTVTLIPPTIDIRRTGQMETVDGISMEFQLTPGTEAPAEMNIFFPDRRTVCVAENATHNMHNVMTPRGALIRDAHAWAAYLDETIELFGGTSDVLFAQHHWPRWGRERIGDFLSKQRDLYAFIHDQALRLMNEGLVGSEIAEELELPRSLEREWHCRGYYGSLSHNVKAVSQRYLGYFDGNPARLWPHPPEPAGERYVALAGGADALLAHAREAFEQGDYRWVAEVVSHAVFADPNNEEARELEAQALEQLGYGAENGAWRNFFLMGAHELRHGIAKGGPAIPPDIVAHLSSGQLFNALAIRLDGPRAAERRLTIHWRFTDIGEDHSLSVRHGVLTHRPGIPVGKVDAFVSVERGLLDEVLAGETTLSELAASGRLIVDGERRKVDDLFELFVNTDPSFSIVWP
jgi:alkyl sulfatase BDS1-like metallo-beta-lactamase superfamily hydrolase